MTGLKPDIPSLGPEVHGDAVDAIAQVGRRRAVGKNVAEVAPATAAMHLGAAHSKTAIDRGFDRTRDGIVEARPAGAALEFSLRREQRLSAARALEGAVAFLEIERAAPGRFGPVLPHDLVLLGREQPAPLVVGMGDWE